MGRGTGTGHRPVRRAQSRPSSLDEMFATATNEDERDAIRVALFGSVMDVVDRYLPDREKHAPVRSMLSFLSVNSTYRGPYTPGSALCLAFALASPGDVTMSKVRAASAPSRSTCAVMFESHGGELRRHTKAERIVVDDGTVRGVELGDGEVLTAPVVVSNLDPTATFNQLIDPESLPDGFRHRIAHIDHRGRVLPGALRPHRIAGVRGSVRLVERRREVSQRDLLRNRRADAAGLRRVRTRTGPSSPSFNLQIPTLHDPDLAPPGEARGEQFRLLPAGDLRPRRPDPLRDEMADRIVSKITRFAPDFPELIERQLNYPAYTYELMFGCTGGDFRHGLLQPEFMGPFRPGPRGWSDQPVPVEGLYLCGAGCHGGPGVTFIPGYNCGYAVLEARSSSLL